MPSREYTLDDGMLVTVSKRRNNKNLRLTVSHTGKVTVTVPTWAPYRAGLSFAKAKQSWIKQQQKPASYVVDSQPIGKAHHLRFVAKPDVSKPRSRIDDQTVNVYLSPEAAATDDKVQSVAKAAAIRALRLEAEQLLPQRLNSLAHQNNFSYASLTIKQLKGRWGSCDQHHNIVLNLFLMQLPWELIDYVILHELTHTRELKHGPDFWASLKTVMPDSDLRRKQIKNFQPVVNTESIKT